MNNVTMTFYRYSIIAILFLFVANAGFAQDETEADTPSAEASEVSEAEPKDEKDAGLSYELGLGLGYSSTNDVARNKIERDATGDFKANEKFAETGGSISPVLSFVANYHLNDSDKISFGFDEGFLLGAQVGTDFAVFVATVLYSPLGSDWKNPYLVNAEREKTSVTYTAVDGLIVMPFLSLEVTNTQKSYAEDLLGDSSDDYARSSVETEIEIAIPVDIDLEEDVSTISIAPFGKSIDAKAKGEVFSYTGSLAGLSLGYSHSSGFEISLKGGSGKNTYKKENVFFENVKREDNITDAELSVVLQTSETVGYEIEWKSVNHASNIDFYDSEESAVAFSFIYTF